MSREGKPALHSYLCGSLAERTGGSKGRGVALREHRFWDRLLLMSRRSGKAGVCSDGHWAGTRVDALGFTCFLLTDCWLTEHLLLHAEAAATEKGVPGIPLD